MRNRIFILALMFASGVPACAQQADTRAEILRALADRSRVRLAPEQVSFSVVPPRNVTFKVGTIRFDPMLHAWAAEFHCVPGPKCLPFLVTVSTNDPDAFRIPVSTSRHLPLVHPGERKLMISGTGSVRVSEPVICLQNGRANQVIRVRTIMTRQIRRALVSQEGQILAANR